MKQKMLRPMTALVAWAIVALPAMTALAAEGGHEEGSSADAWLTLGFTTINFLAFVFLAYRYAWPAARDY